MNDPNAVSLAAIALAGAIVTGFFALVNKQNKTHDRISASLDKVAESNKSIATATEQGNVEAKQRNGHLAELVIQETEKVMGAVGNQSVKEQNVEHQHVTEVTKE